MIRHRAPRNRTLEVSKSEIAKYRKRLVYSGVRVPDAVICGDTFERLPMLENSSFDLIFADPPYNLSKVFGKEKFISSSDEDYENWLDSWIKLCVPLLKANGSMYLCGDWRSSSSIYRVATRYLRCMNRITWEREKGRGAKANWKNASEDIWFFTKSDAYTFNVGAVKQRRRVIAPYKVNGSAKDWNEKTGFRDTHPSNLWTDLTVPFWSMPENTDHPTQKPEKLLAKIILASTNEGDSVLDPFAGSGTTAVVAKKLGRRFVTVESDEQYCLLAAKRLELAETDSTIQGFEDGVFWERNSGQNRER
ncbi:MAG TPA: site-specific DNA-methyltransferase [Pyrinomonadaceae bacterium]|nr:site-specific DNA-methyltransferase [Pyrinomonadaceae bacterium]